MLIRKVGHQPFAVLGRFGWVLIESVRTNLCSHHDILQVKVYTSLINLSALCLSCFVGTVQSKIGKMVVYVCTYVYNKILHSIFINGLIV